MNSSTAKRYHPLNDKTIRFLSQGEIDMSATTTEFGGSLNGVNGHAYVTYSYTPKHVNTKSRL